VASIVDNETNAELEARLTLALARASRSLAIEEVSLVRQRIEKSLAQCQVMRSVALENGDEPDPVFDPAESTATQPLGNSSW
jgi:hypothetical protein